MKESIRQAYYQPWYLPLLQKPKPFNHYARHFIKPYDLLTPDEEKGFWDEANEGEDEESSTDQRKTAKKVVGRVLASGLFSSLGSSLSQTHRDQQKVGGRFAHVTKFAQEQEEPPQISADQLEAQEREDRERQLHETEEKFEEYQEALDKASDRIDDEQERQNDLANRLRTSLRNKERYSADIKQKKLIVAMLANPEEAASELEKMNAKTVKKIQSAGAEWEGRRVPLVEQYHQCIEKQRGDMSYARNLTEELKDVKHQMGSLIEEAKMKQARLIQLRQEYEGMDKAAERNRYVSKITDLHKTLAALQRDIDNVCNFYFSFFHPFLSFLFSSLLSYLFLFPLRSPLM